MLRSTRVGGKSSERMPNHSNIERIRYFLVIFSFLMYFLREISSWDRMLFFWPWLKRNAHVSSPAITLSEFAKAYAPN